MQFKDMVCDGSRLNKLEITLNDIKIADADVMSCELKCSLFHSYINGYVQFRDSSSYTNSTSIKFDGSTTVTINATDVLNTKFKRTFNVVDMSIDDSNPRINVINLKLIDRISYKLGTTFISKSFKTNVVSAFKSCLTEIGVDSLISSDNLNLVTTDSSDSDAFVVPENTPVMDFFNYQCRLNNVRIWQDYNSIYVKEFNVSDAEEKSLGGSTANYSDDVSNNNYAFKIYDFEKINSSKANTTLNLQTQVNYRFTGKTIDKETLNLKDFYTSLLLNKSTIDASLQDTTGEQKTVSYTPIGAQKYDLFNTYIRSNQLRATMKGNFGYTVPGVKANLNLKSKSYNSNQQSSGNVNDSGYYLVTDIIYKFIASRFFQMVMFSRFDNPDPKNP